MIELAITHPKPWIGANKYNRLHWAAQRDLKKAYAAFFMSQITQMGHVGTFDKVYLECYRFETGKGLDDDNLVFGLKPILDALVVPTKANPWGMSLILDDNPHVLTREAIGVQLKRGDKKLARSEFIFSGTIQK